MNGAVTDVDPSLKELIDGVARLEIEDHGRRKELLPPRWDQFLNKPGAFDVVFDGPDVRLKGRSSFASAHGRPAPQRPLPFHK